MSASVHRPASMLEALVTFALIFLSLGELAATEVVLPS